MCVASSDEASLDERARSRSQGRQAPRSWDEAQRRALTAVSTRARCRLRRRQPTTTSCGRRRARNPRIPALANRQPVAGDAGALRAGLLELRGAAAVGGAAALDAPARPDTPGGLDAAQHAAPDAGRERPAHRRHPDGPVRSVGPQPAGRSGGGPGPRTDGGGGQGQRAQEDPGATGLVGVRAGRGRQAAGHAVARHCRRRSSGRWRTWSGAL